LLSFLNGSRVALTTGLSIPEYRCTRRFASVRTAKALPANLPKPMSLIGSTYFELVLVDPSLKLAIYVSREP
jgi:hypothetical protein